MSFQFTANSLQDIIRLLKKGHIVCLYENGNRYYYNQCELLQEITNEKLIYINLTTTPSLLDPDEWPWHINNSGFVEYKSITILPKEESNIFYREL